MDITSDIKEEEEKTSKMVAPVPDKKRLQGLAMDLDIHAYTWFRRHVMQYSYVWLNIHPRGHPCWNNPKEILKVDCCYDETTGLPTRHFYGCQRCGRTHVCLVDSECLTCPRVPSPNNPDSFVCGFSGQELCLIVGTDNASFRRREQILDALKGMMTNRELQNAHRTGIRSGQRVAQSLEHRAILSDSHATRENMYRQAREARQRSRQRKRTLNYERNVLQENKRRYLPALEKATGAAATTIVTMPSSTSSFIPMGGEEALWFEQKIIEHKQGSAAEREREETMEYFRRRIIEAAGAYRYEQEDIHGTLLKNAKERKESLLKTKKEGEEEEEDDEDAILTEPVNDFMDVDPMVMPHADDEEEEEEAAIRDIMTLEEEVRKEDGFLFDQAWDDGDYGFGSATQQNHDDDGDDGQWEEKLYDEEERKHARLTARGILDPTWYAPPIVIPALEMEEDDAFLKSWLDPIADYMEQHCDFSVFGPLSMILPSVINNNNEEAEEETTAIVLDGSSSSLTLTPSPPRPSDPQKKKPLGSPLSFAFKPRKQKARAPRRKRVNRRTLWFVFHPSTEPRDLLPHQRTIRDYVDRFLDYYQPLTPPNLQHPPPEQRWRYILFCDRLLWAYHYETNEFHGPLWPFKPKGGLERILFTILTLILTGPGYGRDPVSQAKVPVWVGCPWLIGMAKAGKFHPAPAHLLSRNNQNLDKLREPLMLILHCQNISPHTLSHFLLPTISIDADHPEQEQVPAPFYVEQRHTELV